MPILIFSPVSNFGDQSLTRWEKSSHLVGIGLTGNLGKYGILPFYG